MINNDPMEPFNRFDMDNLQETLKILLSKEDIEMKTRIKNPMAMAGLEILARACGKIGFVKTAKTYKSYIKHFMQNKVSEDGKSRAEFVDAFKSITEKFMGPMSIGDKLTENLKDWIIVIENILIILIVVVVIETVWICKLLHNQNDVI